MSKINLEYDVKVEVTRSQYWRLVKRFPMIIAHRRDLEKGKYYFKLWYMRYKSMVEDCLYGRGDKYQIKIIKK